MTTLFYVSEEHGGKDKLSFRETEFVSGITDVIQMFMRFSEQPDPYRFTVRRMDGLDLETGKQSEP